MTNSNGKKIKEAWFKWKKLLHNILTWGAITFLAWLLYSTKSFIVTANELPDTVEAMAERVDTNTAMIAMHDSLLHEIRDAITVDSTVQRQILDGIEELIGKKNNESR